VLIAPDSCRGAYSVVHGEVTGPSPYHYWTTSFGLSGLQLQHIETSPTHLASQPLEAIILCRGAGAKYISDIVNAKTCS
jgi:hypothetical protein